MDQFEDAVRRELEGFEVGEEIELFTVDLTAFGGEVYRFTPAPKEEGVEWVVPVFGGNSYTVIPFVTEGWEWSAGGPLPQPSVKFLLARADGDQISPASYLLSLVEAYDDLIGATVTRVRTLHKYLDGGEEADPKAHFGTEVYTIARKVNQNPDMIEFQLQSSLDLEDVQLPRRQVLSYCPFRYRIGRADGSFDYENATCPYVGAAMFDALGNPVAAAADDRCGKLLSECKRRFGANAKLPFGGFPGAGRFRRS